MAQGRDVLSSTTTDASRARPIASCLFCCGGRPAVRRFRVISSTFMQAARRSTHLRKELGGGSLTALPIIETEAQNISAYIPTNPDFHHGWPDLSLAIAIRVGRAAGSRCRYGRFHASAAKRNGRAYRPSQATSSWTTHNSRTRNIRPVRARLDESTRKVIEHGRRIRACLKQAECSPVSARAQIAVLLTLTARLFDGVSLDQMPNAEQRPRRGSGHPATCALDSNSPTN